MDWKDRDTRQLERRVVCCALEEQLLYGCFSLDSWFSLFGVLNHALTTLWEIDSSNDNSRFFVT